jgi:hypothetical protein
MGFFFMSNFYAILDGDVNKVGLFPQLGSQACILSHGVEAKTPGPTPPPKRPFPVWLLVLIIIMGAGIVIAAVVITVIRHRRKKARGGRNFRSGHQEEEELVINN